MTIVGAGNIYVTLQNVEQTDSKEELLVEGAMGLEASEIPRAIPQAHLCVPLQSCLVYFVQRFVFSSELRS